MKNPFITARITLNDKVIIMEIIKQTSRLDESVEINGTHFRCSHAPELQKSIVYLKGNSDTSIAMKSFESKAIAKLYGLHLVNNLKALNNMVAAGHVAIHPHEDEEPF